MTAGSEVPTTPLTTDGVGGPWGATLGRYKQEKPSALMSNSTKAGVTDDPCMRLSRGVVIDTRHLTLVRGTDPPDNREYKGFEMNIVLLVLLGMKRSCWR